MGGKIDRARVYCAGGLGIDSRTNTKTFAIEGDHLTISVSAKAVKKRDFII